MNRTDRLMEGYFLPPLSFTATEAALLVLGGRFVRDRLDPELQRAANTALDKLAGVLPPERRQDVDRWRREIAFTSFGRVARQAHLAAIRQAIQNHRVLRIRYHAYRRPGAERRDVEPIMLVNLSEAWHLSAYCRLRRDRRLFRLDRIDRLEPLDDRFDLDERHVIGPDKYDAQLARFAEARVRFDPAVVRWVRERQPWVFLREEPGPDGPVFVYALRDERELLTWLLSWGAAAELLSPPDLRASLAREARTILDRHAEAGSEARTGTRGGRGAVETATTT